jgi:hypothetical protein
MDTNSTGSSFETDLLEHLCKLFGDPSELQTFKHWFTRALWEADSVESTASDDILELAYLVENLIAILDSGVWTEDEFITTLREETEKKFGETPSGRDKITPVRSTRSRASA